MMPVVFIGHGSPINAIEDNDFTRRWIECAEKLPTPKAILLISAHWYIEGLKVLGSTQPKMIYDMYGFPDDLYKVVYDAPGAPDLAPRVQELLLGEQVSIDKDRGFDHGNWSVLRHMYPDKNIPVTQLSLDSRRPAEDHFALGRKLRPLREEGVLIIGSGNVVHNVRAIDWNLGKGYEWAGECGGFIKRAVLDEDFNQVVNYRQAGDPAALSVPTPDHFLPLLYVLGAADSQEPKEVLNETGFLGSLSMTCYVLGVWNEEQTIYLPDDGINFFKLRFCSLIRKL